MDSNFRFGSRCKPVRISPKMSVAVRQEMSGYAAILLREFNNLVGIIMLLDETEVKRFDHEINFAVEQLNSWCENMSATHTLKVFCILRRLQTILRGEESPVVNIGMAA